MGQARTRLVEVSAQVAGLLEVDHQAEAHRVRAVLRVHQAHPAVAVVQAAARAAAVPPAAARLAVEEW